MVSVVKTSPVIHLRRSWRMTSNCTNWWGSLFSKRKSKSSTMKIKSVLSRSTCWRSRLQTTNLFTFQLRSFNIANFFSWGIFQFLWPNLNLFLDSCITCVIIFYQDRFGRVMPILIPCVWDYLGPDQFQTTRLQKSSIDVSSIRL